MNKNTSGSDNADVLVLKRIFAAPIDRVFDAWTNAEVLAKWFGPEGFEVSHAEIDLSVGGRYEIIINSPEGKAIKHFGSYIQINKPEQLVFTWMLENQLCKGSEGQNIETLVSIQFKQIEQSTEITLTHEQLPSKESYDGHRFGWNSSFDSLDGLFSNKI